MLGGHDHDWLEACSAGQSHPSTLFSAHLPPHALVAEQQHLGHAWTLCKQWFFFCLQAPAAARLFQSRLSPPRTQVGCKPTSVFVAVGGSAVSGPLPQQMTGLKDPAKEVGISATTINRQASRTRHVQHLEGTASSRQGQRGCTLP